jgi:flagellar basal-body rod modification protein FlgD
MNIASNLAQNLFPNLSPNSANLPATRSAAKTSSTGGTDGGTSGISDLFLQLLATQLKSQSPADPVDPTAFMGQLIQFNSLDQLTQIKQILANGLTGTGSGK